MKTNLLICALCLFGGASAQTVSKYIIVDQFGYRPDSEKIAVIRNPIEGFDASESFAPGNNYQLVDVQTNASVFSGSIEAWKGGNVDQSSGDMVWWFDFSTFEIPGNYYILDVDNNVKSNEFTIDEHVYAEVLKHAVRTFFYQRAGFDKEANYSGESWADPASHLGFRQDSECRKFDDRSNSSLQRDLRGGWYDAGDYNKYTPWTSNYIVDLLKAYEESPAAWGDDYCLPYSGNGIPDIIDEIKWGLDYLLRLQESDGSLISVVALDGGAPPSSASGSSLYGDVNTTSTLAAIGAYAYGAKVFEGLGMTSFSTELKESAILAWNWAEANPRVIWENNSAAFNSVGIGAGQQETNDYGRLAYKIRAAIHLFEVTSDNAYNLYLENNYQDIHLVLWTFAFPFEQENQGNLLYYASLPGASVTVANTIREKYEAGMNAENNFVALRDESDPYMAYLKDYVWGSNGTKSRKGLMFTDYINHDINSQNNDDAERAAERYLHYIHGVNPLNLVYLSNMYDFGAENSVNQFYHTWFDDGSDWDEVGNSLYGPPPGFLVGGANPTYDWDGCCPSNCGGRQCDATQRSRVRGQPQQKAYDDFNTNWPMNSWSVTENSGGYQVAYIRLLSKFVNLTGLESVECNIDEEVVTSLDFESSDGQTQLYPNPTNRFVTIKSDKASLVRIFNMQGTHVLELDLSMTKILDMEDLPDGVYFIQLLSGDQIISETKLIKTKN